MNARRLVYTMSVLACTLIAIFWQRELADESTEVVGASTTAATSESMTESSKQPVEQSAALLSIHQTLLSSLTAESLATIRCDRHAIRAVHEAFRSKLATSVGPALGKLSDLDEKVIVACAVAYWSAPYGQSQALEFDDLRQSTALNCLNYGLLTWYFLEALCAEADLPTVKFVGWESDTIGNHQLMFIESGDKTSSLIVDSTIGLIARADFDQVASSRQVDSAAMVLVGNRPDIQPLRDRIVTALKAGSLRPSELLYSYQGKDSFLKAMRAFQADRKSLYDWATPGVVIWRRRYHPEDQ
ncbi:MAG: hypothetical protein AB7I37_04840 [Pirellulales bacterium]